jgi:hypothetical protein
VEAAGRRHSGAWNVAGAVPITIGHLGAQESLAPISEPPPALMSWLDPAARGSQSPGLDGWRRTQGLYSGSVYSTAALFLAGAATLLFAGVTAGAFPTRFFGRFFAGPVVGSELAKLKSEDSGAF